MALTMNVKSTKSFYDLFPSMFTAATSNHKMMIDYCKSSEVYYQPKCIDILIPVEVGSSSYMYCIRVNTPLAGALMSGNIGKAPKQELAKGLKYLLSGAATDLTNGGLEALKIDNAVVGTMSGQVGTCDYGLYFNYPSFLKAVGDAKATPKGMQETAPKDGLLDFSKLQSAGGGEFKKLTAASELGQPVQGTSSDSVYRVAALTTMLAVAYRYSSKQSRISIRLEPRKGNKFNSGSPLWATAQGAGMDVHFNEAYASCHILVKSIKQARRVLGAILSDLELETNKISFQIKDT